MAQYDLTQLMSLVDLSKKDNVFLSYTPQRGGGGIDIGGGGGGGGGEGGGGIDIGGGGEPYQINELSIFSLQLINQYYKGAIVTIIDPYDHKNTLDLYYTKETIKNYLPSGGDLTDSNNTIYLGEYIENYSTNVILVKWYDQSGNEHNMSSFIPENRPSISLDNNSYLQVDFAPVKLNQENTLTPTFLNVTDTVGGPIPSFASETYTVICQYNTIAPGGGICAYGLNQGDNPFNPSKTSGDNISSTVNNFILTTNNTFENSFNYDVQKLGDGVDIDTTTFVGATLSSSEYNGNPTDYTQNNNSLTNKDKLSLDKSTNHIIEEKYQSYNPSSYNFIIFTYDRESTINDSNFNIYNVVSNNERTITVNKIQSTNLEYTPNKNTPFFDFHLIGAYKNLGTFNLIEDTNTNIEDTKAKDNGQLYNLITFQRALIEIELQKYISKLIETYQLQAPIQAPIPKKL
jgi:hypothetical protein